VFRQARIQVEPVHVQDADMLLGLDYARTRHLWLSCATRQLFVVPSLPRPPLTADDPNDR
jgi:hypothetical protein